MGALHKRLTALEAVKAPSGLSPQARQWLGLELTPEEQADLDRHVVEPDSDEVDWSDYSPEVRAWLQQE